MRLKYGCSVGVGIAYGLPRPCPPEERDSLTVLVAIFGVWKTVAKLRNFPGNTHVRINRNPVKDFFMDPDQEFEDIIK